ncbi:MAG: V-type ATP synthase subunit B [Gammaproteobacteria bacterium]|jgi:V/A-type H+-transporting ATPase subunit B
MPVERMHAQLTLTQNAERLEGSLLFMRRPVHVAANFAVHVRGQDGRRRMGRIVALDETHMTIEILDQSMGLNLDDVEVDIFYNPIEFGVGPGILGRVFNGVGQVIDGGPPIAAHEHLAIDGLPINPVERETPRDFIETGVSSIDILNSLVRGQKLPFFSGAGLPHDRLAVQIARDARLRSSHEDFAIVFAGIGVPYDSAEYYRRSLEESGALERTALFLNLASDSSTQRLLTPRFALTAAEYLAFEQGKHVLVILTDMTNYCEALREVSTGLGEIPSRKGYPGYMYSDLATLYERAGRIHGHDGTLTQMPILSMPADDITHPIPDLSGYITEGQIVFDRVLDRQGVFPPIKVLPSLSRLMKDGTGRGYTHEDHPALATQLYAAYARARQARVLASVVGEDGLSPTDRLYLEFGTRFEREFVQQDGRRSLEQSMEIGWRLLAVLPLRELHRLSDEQIETYIKPQLADA